MLYICYSKYLLLTLRSEPLTLNSEHQFSIKFIVHSSAIKNQNLPCQNILSQLVRSLVGLIHLRSKNKIFFLLKYTYASHLVFLQQINIFV